jgi:hypothetical protein
MARRRSRSQAAGVSASEVLAPHAAEARARELLKERARLLRDVQKKQQLLEQIKQRTSRVADDAVAKMAPIVARRNALALTLAALFDELAAGRLTARARRQLERLRRSLELQGLLEPRVDSEQGVETEWHEAAGPGAGRAGDASPGARRGGARRPPASGARPEVAGARQVGQERRSLRELFRSLARAIHPDQARHEGERQRRTEVMKQVTRAYEEGDLARLVELESAWHNAHALSESADPEQRCRELSRQNGELLKQLREVTRQLRDAKRELLEAELSHPSAELVELASLELDDVEGICEMLRRFRDGKISISDLTEGPLPTPRRRRRARV